MQEDVIRERRCISCVVPEWVAELFICVIPLLWDINNPRCLVTEESFDENCVAISLKETKCGGYLYLCIFQN